MSLSDKLKEQDMMMLWTWLSHGYKSLLKQWENPRKPINKMLNLYAWKSLTHLYSKINTVSKVSSFQRHWIFQSYLSFFDLTYPPTHTHKHERTSDCFLNFIFNSPLSQFNVSPLPTVDVIVHLLFEHLLAAIQWRWSVFVPVSLLAIESVVYCLNPVFIQKGFEATLDCLKE